MTVGLAMLLEGVFLLEDNIPRDRFYIDMFCAINSLEVLDIGVDFREGEVVYYFTDNLGGYTINGVISSLSDYDHEPEYGY